MEGAKAGTVNFDVSILSSRCHVSYEVLLCVNVVMRMRCVSFVPGSISLGKLYSWQGRAQKRHSLDSLNSRGTVRARLLPHVVVLPGLDGSGVLLEKFLASLKREPGRSIRALEYPKNRYLNYDELEHYVRNALEDDKNDERGHVLVAQSYSTQVVLRIPVRARVLVNGFISAPLSLPSYAWRIVPNAIWGTLPPPALTAPLFMGGTSAHARSEMAAIHEAAASVLPQVMTSRLRACLNEDAWHLWRDREKIPTASTMYIAGGSDRIVGSTSHANLMRVARDDIIWKVIPNAPHLLLQTHPVECARLVDEFVCDC